eukprot:724538-Amorphochlora_amoeboformis.AAC.1
MYAHIRVVHLCFPPPHARLGWRAPSLLDVDMDLVSVPLSRVRSNCRSRSSACSSRTCPKLGAGNLLVVEEFVEALRLSNSKTVGEDESLVSERRALGLFEGADIRNWLMPG